MVLATSPQEFSDAEFRIVDNGDQSKKLAFELSGITTGTTRTWTVPDANVTISSFAATLLDDTTQTAALTTLASSAVATFLLTPSSANFAALLSDETGTGNVAFATTGTTTPTPTSDGGNFTTASCSLTYTKVGTRVLFDAVITITTVGGSASGAVIIALPFTPNADSVAAARNASTGLAGSFQISNGSGTGFVRNYDNSSMIAAGASIRISGQYRTT